MRVLLFGDVHGDIGALERVAAQKADLFIDVGDLATFGRGLERCGEALKPLGERLWVLPGNHETHADTRKFCEKFGFTDFHGQARTLETRGGTTHWAGLGYSNITPFNTPGEYTEEEMAAALATFDGIGPPLYLAVHCPPLNTKLDEYAPGKHAGSSAVRDWVERVQPNFLFCGHIHETAGMQDTVGRTKCINVGKQGYSMDI